MPNHSVSTIQAFNKRAKWFSEVVGTDIQPVKKWWRTLEGEQRSGEFWDPLVRKAPSQAKKSATVRALVDRFKAWQGLGSQRAREEAVGTPLRGPRVKKGPVLSPRENGHVQPAAGPGVSVQTIRRVKTLARELGGFPVLREAMSVIDVVLN